MFAAVLCYLSLLLVPAYAVLFSLRCRQAISSPASSGGYPTDGAPASAEAWRQVQQMAASRLMISGVLALVCGIGFMLLMPFADMVSLLCCAGIALGLEIVVLLIGMTTIGMAIQSHFKPASL